MARPLSLLPVLLLAASPAMSLDPRDPTKPPPGYGSETPAPPPKVSSLMLRPDGRSVAIVNGEPVKVGDRLAEGRVTRIDEGGIWIKTVSGQLRIGLLPAVTKKPAAVPGRSEKR